MEEWVVVEVAVVRVVAGYGGVGDALELKRRQVGVAAE